MFNPNWFLLILFIKVLIAAIGLIQGAPIDLVPAPLTSSTEVHNDNQTVTVPNEDITTATTEKLGEHNHVDVDSDSDDLIAINEDFENETTTLPSLDISRNGKESQQEVTATTTGSPSATQRNDQIHVQVIIEEVSEFSNFPISTENPHNISHHNLAENQSVYTEKSSLISNESVDNATDQNQREIINSQIKTGNPQKSSEQNISEIQQIAEQPLPESVQIPGELQIREIFKSPIETENPQIFTKQNLGEIQQITEEPSTQTSLESKQPTEELKISEVFNSPIEKTENPQITKEQNLAEIQQMAEEPSTQTSLESVQLPGEPKIVEVFNSQIETENPQISTKPNLTEIEQITEEPSTQTSPESVQSPREPKIVEVFNSQIETENPQISTKPNLTEIEQITEEPSTQTSLESKQLPGEQTDSENINSHIINENPQNSSELSLMKIQQLVDESSLDTTQEPRIIEIVDSQIKSENAQNSIGQSGNTLQLSTDGVYIPGEPQTSVFSDSDIGNENTQNTIQRNLPEKQELNEESGLQTAFKSVSDPEEPKISEVLNSEQANENTQNITNNFSKVKTDLNQANSQQQINAQIIEITKIEEAKVNGNSQIEKENAHINISAEQMPEQSGNNNSTLTSENSPINSLIEKADEIDSSLTEMTFGILNNLKETQSNDSTNSPSTLQDTEEDILSQKISSDHDAQTQKDLQSPEVIKTQEVFENSHTQENTEKSKEMSLSEEISTVINLLNPAESQESANSENINFEVSTAKSEITEKNLNEPQQQVNSVEFSSPIPFENTHLNSFVEEINQNIGFPSEESPKSDLNEENILSQLLRENFQNPSVSSKPETVEINDDQLTQTNFHVTEENNDNFNSQTFNENLQNADIIAMLQKFDLNEDNFTKADKKDQHWASNSENINVEVFPENSESIEKDTVEENTNIGNVINMNSQETGESRNFNSQISTENPPIAGIYVLMEKNELPTENINNNSSEQKDNGNTQENTQSVTENPQNIDTIELLKENPTESQVLNENTQNIAATTLLETSAKDPSQMKDNLKATAPKEEQEQEESLVNATKNASLENIGMMENTNGDTENQMKLSKTPTSLFENNARLPGEDHGTKPVDNTSLFYDPNSSEEVEDAITTEGVAETPTETRTETPSTTPQAMEESTFIPAEDLQNDSKANNDVNLQNAFETLTESFKTTEILEANTAQPLDTTPPAAMTEAGTGEETTDTTTNDRTPYVKATTHRQFASLLEETEMNVHKAFETLREWIANGKKLEDATKNPLHPEDATTMRTQEETEDNGILVSNEYSTTEKSEETTSTLNENTEESSTKEESSSAFEKDDTEITDTTISPILTTTAPSQDNSFFNSEGNVSLVQTTDNIEQADEETTINNQEKLESITTEQAKETSEDQGAIETTTQNDFASATTVEPIFARVNLQKDLTGVSLTHFDDSSEEIVAEDNAALADKIDKTANDSSNEGNVYQNPVTELIQEENTTDKVQDMVTFIEHQPTTQKQETSQNQLTQTQASFMEEQQQQIESTTETDMSSQSISKEGESTTMGELNETTTPTTEVPSTTTDSVSTTIVVPVTTTVLPLTTTTAEDLTTTTEEPEVDTTTLVVAVEPEARSLPLPPPKLEYLQNEDGVEVFYGYSIVKHN